MPEIATLVSLAPYTTFKIGGKATHFAVAGSLSVLQELITWSKEQNLPILVLGGGSNVLIADSGFKGLVIKLELNGVTYKTKDDAVLVTAEAGMVLDDLVKETVEKNLWGLENLSHIPGSVGATPVQNVGAYGVEVSNLITEVVVLNTDDNSLQNFTNEECQFGYRSSFFKTDLGRKYIVVSVIFSLRRELSPQLEYKDLKNYFTTYTTPSLSEIREAVIQIRSQKFPDWTVVGTAGSFFTNPIITKSHFTKLLTKYPDLPGYEMTNDRIKVPLGWILDKVCNLRGYQVGNVGTYEAQSLVVVNYGDATAAEVKSFADRISEKVFQATEIKIEWEVTEVKFL